jgi:hypothetical protein
MNKLIFLLLSVSMLLGLDLQSSLTDSRTLHLRLNFEAPQIHSLPLQNGSLELPRWPDAYLAYDSTTQALLPYYSIPFLIAPDGQLPALNIIASESVADRRFLDQQVQKTDLRPENSIHQLVPQSRVEIEAGPDFRSFKTGRLRVYPYFQFGDRLTAMELELHFPVSSTSGRNDDAKSIQHFINAPMAQSWSTLPKRSLSRTAAVPSGTWYKIPIESMGIYKITSNSFGTPIPDSDPRSWQVYAPAVEGRSLPFALSNTEPTPDNLKSISVQGMGLDDGQFDAGDEINFFAQALNGDFKGDNFTHLYGTERFYWLCIPSDGIQNGQQITPLASATGAAGTTISHYEKRLYHETENINQLHSGQSWVGEKLTGNADQYSYYFNDNYLYMSGECKLNVLFMADYDLGYFNHDVRVELNGLPFNTNVQSSAYYRTINVTGSAGANMLADGPNTLRLYYNSNSNSSIVYLDSLRLAYTRYLAPSSDYLFGTVHLEDQLNRLVFRDLPSDFQVWDISDPAQVTEWQLENSEFVAPGTGAREIIGFSNDQKLEAILETAPDMGTPVLRVPNRQADYIIVTPEQFTEQAERIRLLREEQVAPDEQLNVEIIQIDDIYWEFSAGTLDPAAIKHFFHYVYFNWEAPRLRYVLFLGDTDYDYRNISGQSKMIIPTYQKDGVSDVGSYATDDKYSFIASGIWDELPDFAMGRYPAQTVDQLEIMIDKLVNYVLDPEPGIWQNTITLVADDPLRPSNSIETEHIRDSESLGRILPQTTHINKVYLTEYPEVSDPNSPYIKKPKAREDFIQKLYNGTLVVNYLGHGSPNVWAQEEVFTANDLGLVKTGMKLPFWVAGTCDWAKYDDVNSTCVPEELMLMDQNGAVGILSCTRKTYSYFNNILLSDFFDYLFPEDNSSRSITVGEAIMMAKNNPAGSDVNNEKYILFSDPALKLASPRGKGQIESLNPATLSAMGKVSYSGFTDTLLGPEARGAVTVYDTPTPVTRTFVINSSGATSQISYVLPGKRIFRGLISVDGTDFNGEFTVPKDIKYAGTGGILSVQYWDDAGASGTVFVDTLRFEGTDLSAADDTGPDILFISDNMIMMNGDHFSANDILEIEIADEQGINLTGAAGHGISLAIDEDWDNAYSVTELFEYDLDHSDKGRLSTYLSEISPGEHLISVKAWDSQNNPSEASVRLEFFASNDFRIYDLFNYPNPMSDQTLVSYMLSHEADVSYAIYTLAGRKIYKGDAGFQPQGFNSFPWNGEDLYGNQIANGVYILVIEGENSTFEKPSQSLQKIVIAR